MKKLIFFGLVLIFSLSFSLVAAQQATAHYDVVMDKSPIKLDGMLTEPVWNDIGAIEGGFHFPWEAQRAPVTSFKAFQDGQNFYFSFVAYDNDIVKVDKWLSESTVDQEDRVELFFAPTMAIDQAVNYKLPPYYAIEVDPWGRVHDYSTVYYRQLDTNWDLAGLQTVGMIEQDKYVVEGLIPISSFKKLGLLNDQGVMRVGVYRAEFSKLGNELNMRWISWVDPKTADPDYHVDSSFGEFRFLSQ